MVATAHPAGFHQPHAKAVVAAAIPAEHAAAAAATTSVAACAPAPTSTKLAIASPKISFSIPLISSAFFSVDI